METFALLFGDLSWSCSTLWWNIRRNYECFFANQDHERRVTKQRSGSVSISRSYLPNSSERTRDPVPALNSLRA